MTKRPKSATKAPLPLVDRIMRRQAKIGVVGLGYVGLPLAVAFADAGFQVLGIDTDPQKIRRIRAGTNYIPDVSDAALKKWVQKGRLQATSDFEQLKGLDAVSICVPTPLRKTRDPDISYIVEVTQQLKKAAHPDMLVVLESTTYPGTTEEILVPALQSSTLKVGKNLFLAFSPERIDPGNPKFGLQNTPKIIGGITERCTQIATLLYRQIIREVIPVSTARAAEMVKLLENTFRAVNIGLVNEIAVICDKLKINAWEVIGAAASKPFGFMPFYPGPGLGGHCIPVDPHYLSWKLRSMNYTTRFIELASEINQSMPAYVFQKTQTALNERKKALKGSRILILGVAYKKNVSDVRESPAYDLAKLLEEAGSILQYSDPHVAEWSTENASYRSQSLTPALLGKMDCAIVVTDHDDFSYSKILKHSKLVVDTRNALRDLPQTKVIRL